MEEFEFMLDFVKDGDFGFNVRCRQLRNLWTAYCLHNNMECDTRCYDNDIRDIYKVLEKNTSYPWRDNDEEGIIGFELFDMYMGEELS